MKRSLKFNITYDKKDKFVIFLGRNTKITCKNKTQLIKYVSTYKKVLTDNVNILNNLEMQFYQLYRTNFLLLDSFVSLKIKKILHAFDDSFERIFNGFSDQNHNSFQMMAIQNCFHYLYDIIDILKPFSQIGKHYTLISQLSFLNKNLDILKKQFRDDKISLNLNHYFTQSKLRILHNTLSERLGA